MLILILTDIHGQRSVASRIDTHLSTHTYDGVFMLGDLCNRNDRNALQFADTFIDLITNKYHLSLFCVHGNNEPDEVVRLYTKRDVTVHFNPKSFDTYTVVGIGYGDTLPTDPHFAAGNILLTHEPPRAATLRKMETMDLPHAPLIHFAGHLHSMAKVWRLKNSIMVHVPSAMYGRAATLQLPDLHVSYISL